MEIFKKYSKEKYEEAQGELEKAQENFGKLADAKQADWEIERKVGPNRGRGYDDWLEDIAPLREAMAIAEMKIDEWRGKLASFTVKAEGDAHTLNKKYDKLLTRVSDALKAVENFEKENFEIHQKEEDTQNTEERKDRLGRIRKFFSGRK